MFCESCGAKLENNARFCESCGTPQSAVPAPAQPQASAYQQPSQTGSVGYSHVINSPEFLLCVKKHHKRSRRAAIVFTILLPLLGASGGAVIGEGSAAGIVIGTILGFAGIAVLWSLTEKEKKKKRALPDAIDGTITNINYYGSGGGIGEGGDAEKKYTAAKITLVDSAGREHDVEIKFRNEIYNYYKIGEAVRYHTKINFPEKYDKSRDSYSVCALCLYKEAVHGDRCPVCDAPLLK